MFTASRIIAACLTLAAAQSLSAQDTLRIAGPYHLPRPIATDTADVWFQPFNTDRMLMDKSVSPQMWKNNAQPASSILPPQEETAVWLVGMEVENTMFAKCTIYASGGAERKVFIDGKEGAEQNLTPGRHELVMKVLQKPSSTDTIQMQFSSPQMQYCTIQPTSKRRYTLDDYLHGERASSTQLSTSGRYMLFNSYIKRTDGNTEWRKCIIDLKTGAELPAEGFHQWSTTSDRYVRSRRTVDMQTCYEYVDPATGKTEHLFTDPQYRSLHFVAGEKLAQASEPFEGPKEDPQLRQMLNPEDHVAGWRNRSNITLIHLETGQTLPLTMGQQNVSARLSDDGTQALVFLREYDATTQPHFFTKLLLVNLQTMKADTLVQHDGFVDEAFFSPNGQKIAVIGSADAFDGLGRNLPQGMIANSYQKELYLLDIATRKAEPLTYDFNPSVDNVWWSRADGHIYALCANRDHKNLFRLNMKTHQWKQITTTESYISSLSLARQKPLLSYTGQSACNGSRVYTIDLRNDRETLMRDEHPARFNNIELATCTNWNFQSSRGDTIYGRYYLPPYFNEHKKYPMLVYYYGGVFPTESYMDSFYNFHNLAAMGYVVYVIQPSGCNGFGQEFAARHSNAWGKYTADDIIEGTKKFCAEHSYVNDKKIGCFGASYGGFMTMYLTTQTNLFAAAMSHAGISNVASFWGFGYWGYSYNTTAAPHSYPWNNIELMSANSPLFNADKVHTPILFLHGEADTNVPLAESVQMFKALKILGRECALVTIEGENHHITNYHKQIKWMNTYYAWFAKWLMDDPTWWDTLYPKKNL